MTVDLPGKQERLNFFKADGASIDQFEKAGLRRRRVQMTATWCLIQPSAASIPFKILLLHNA